jgi:hypothetical protein
VTVRFVEATTAPSVAVIADVPIPMLVARPWFPPKLLIVATVSVPEVHVTKFVMFCVLPSEYVPVAVNC